jgi:hypothetical protein
MGKKGHLIEYSYQMHDKVNKWLSENAGIN